MDCCNHSDVAKRASGVINMHLVANKDNATGRWVAIALSDGSSDNTLYDSKRDAVRHQKHNEQLFAFVCIRPGGMSIHEAESFMRTNRMLYDAGFRLPDPDDVNGGRDFIAPLRKEQLKLMGRLIGGKKG